MSSALVSLALFSGSFISVFQIAQGQIGHKVTESADFMARLLRSGLRGYFTSQIRMGSDQLGELGKGAGKGGGAGGSVREAGGAFGKKEAAEEERYFKQKEMEQLAALRKHHQEEIDHHKKEIERLQKEIDRHKGKIRKLKHDD